MGSLERKQALTTIDRTLAGNIQRIATRLPFHPGESKALHLARARRVVQIAIGQCRDNPRLLDCDPHSVIKSVIAACEHGLELGGVLGQAYLVPYKRQCQMQPGYKGLIVLALRSGHVTSITAEVVNANDAFECVLGSDPRLVHSPAMNNAGKPVAVYAVAQMAKGGPIFRVMTIDQVEAIRAGSQGKDLDPWKLYWNEMAKKTAIRALCKYLPQAPDAHAAAVRDEYMEAGIAVPEIDVGDVEFVDVEAEEPPKKGTAGVKAALEKKTDAPAKPPTCKECGAPTLVGIDKCDLCKRS